MFSFNLKEVFNKVLHAALWCTAVILLLQNILLSRENHYLAAKIAAPLPQIQVGQTITSIVGATVDGSFKSVELPSDPKEKLIVFSFSPGCPGCRENFERWTRVAEEFHKKAWRVVWVSRDPLAITKSYILDKNINLSEVISDPPIRTYRQLDLAAVPSTIIVGSGGVVEQVWYGVLAGEKWSGLVSSTGIGPNFTPASGLGQLQSPHT